MALTNFNDSIEVACPYCGKPKKAFFGVLGTNEDSHKRTFCPSCEEWFFVSAKIKPVAIVYAIAEAKGASDGE